VQNPTSRSPRRSLTHVSALIASMAMASMLAVLLGPALTCAVAQASSSSGAVSASSASGLVLIGPQEGLLLNKTYGYNVALTNTWRYTHVQLRVSVPAAHFQLTRPVALLPGKVLMLRFRVRYGSASLLARGMELTITLPGGRSLVSRHYALRLAPGGSGRSGGSVPSRPPGVYLAENNPSCPLTNVMLKTPYRCIVDIVNGPTVYQHVVLDYVVSSDEYESRPPISVGELPANGEVSVTIAVTYGTDPIGDSELSTAAVQLGVGYGSFVRPVVLYRNKYGVSLAPGQQITPLPTPMVSG
jgi:hypothetical protein